MVKFIHYKSKDKYSDPLWGWSFAPSRKQSVLDFYFGKHVLVFFFWRKEK